MVRTKRLTSRTRTWLVPTSPRSPYKLRNELELLARLDGCQWWKKEDEHLIYQLKFAQMLKESDFFEGTISEENPAFSARDRCRAFWTFGFAFVDSDGFLRITPAGRRLIQGIRIEELFLKQLLKWQYPSWQHGGNPKTKHNYLVKIMDVFPFVETLRVIKHVNWLTKKEMAIFLLSCLSKDKFREVPSAIKSFRKEIMRKPSGRPRKEFLQNVHRGRFFDLYREDIEIGRIATREIPTRSVEDFLAKKMRNSLDYADAATRYFQYTGFLTRTPRGLEIMPYFENEVDRILNETRFDIMSYDEVDRFYERMGNPNLPWLSWENVGDMQARIEKIGTRITETTHEIKVLDSSFSVPEKPRSPTEITVENLVDYHYKVCHHLRELRKELMTRDMQRPEKVREIVEMFERIANRQVVDPALFFEWNTWRAFLALNDCYAKPNFQMDSELMPLFHAGGNKSDIEVYFNEKYITLLEVTLSGGARQYYTETEPVTRHIGRFQERERKKDGTKVFGIFIAPRINPYTLQYFYTYFSKLEFPDAGYLTIIPFSLQQFIDFLKFCIKFRCFNKDSFRELLDRIDNLKTVVKNGKEFYTAISKEIITWKKIVLAKKF